MTLPAGPTTSHAAAPATTPPTPQALVAAHRSFATMAGIELRDAPAPLFRLLVLACLLAAPIHHTTAIRASLALRPLTRSAAALATATPEQVAQLLTAAGYWRFHQAKAALLVRAAQHVIDDVGGDLRRLYREADSAHTLHRRLTGIPGVGAGAAHIVLREAQWVWPDLHPYLDQRALDGAAQLGLPDDPDTLGGLVDPIDLPRLAAACVLATLAPARVRAEPG